MSEIERYVRALEMRVIELERRLAGLKVREAELGVGDGSFWASIISATEETSQGSGEGQNRYVYQIKAIRKTGDGYLGWEFVQDAPELEAYNSIENYNGAGGQLGNGVHTTNLEGTFKLKPVPNLTIVRAWPVKAPAGKEYWFAYENGVDGQCDDV